MGFDVSAFRANMQGDGARANLFEVQLNLPSVLQGLNSGNAFSSKLIFSARTSFIPESTVNPIPVQYFGRTINLAGNRTFGEWTITVYNDEDFLVRQTLEKWLGMINTHVSNVRDSSMLSPNSYVSDGSVYQYSKIGGTTGSSLVTYTFKNAWPTNISQIDLDWGNNDIVEEFQVTLAFDEWVLGNDQDFPNNS